MADRIVGHFAGFDLLVSPLLDGDVPFLLKGDTQHPVGMPRLRSSPRRRRLKPTWPDGYCRMTARASMVG